MDFLPDIFSYFSITGAAVANLVFFLSAAFAAVASLILFFHWRKYGMGGEILALTEVVYLVGAVALIFAAFINM